MPIYEYHCSACSKNFEIRQKLSEAPLSSCPHCQQASVSKQLAAPALQFKGDGWYVTDYKKSGADKKSETQTPSSSDKQGKSSE